MEKSLIVDHPNVTYTDEFINCKYNYFSSNVKVNENEVQVFPKNTVINIRTSRCVPKLGLMLVGIGGNNGSTITAALLANKHKLQWNTKDGTKFANWYGSITQSSTVRIGKDLTSGKDVFWPLGRLLPSVNPDDIVIDGWDISSLDLAGAMERSRVLDYDLQVKLKPFMEKIKPRPSLYYPGFIASNQAERADNVIPECTHEEAIEIIRNDIRNFKAKSGVDKVVVLWTANTERMCWVMEGVNDTADNLLQSVKNNHPEISPSTIFALAAIMENAIYINGSPQNTFVPGCVEFAETSGTFIAGDDFKSGQTKVKSVLTDFLISAGIKPMSIVSYNHLGNNDGKNLSSPEQFESKEVSKSHVIDDMVSSNPLLYAPNEEPDHCVVIKYVPYVGDSKRAMDEYVSEICMGGKNTIAIHNTCEDSLLAAPIILDLAILAELCTRIQFWTDSDPANVANFNSVLSVLSYLVKAPLVKKDAPVVNSLFRQRSGIENVLKACIGLPPENNMDLETKVAKHIFEE